MKKWPLYALALAAIMLLSFGEWGGQDVGKLSPVQVVLLRSAAGDVQLLTDAGDFGAGEDAAKAIMNMKEASSKTVFLDTAEYLLMEPGTEKWLGQLQHYLRPSCNLCYVTGEADLQQAGQFLQLHKPELTMTDYEAGDHQLPHLLLIEGRMRLERP